MSLEPTTKTFLITSWSYVLHVLWMLIDRHAKENVTDDDAFLSRSIAYAHARGFLEVLVWVL